MLAAAVAFALVAAACGDDDAETTATTVAASTTAPAISTTTTTTTPAATTATTGPFVPPPPPVTTPPQIDVEVGIGGAVVIGTLDEPATLNPLARGGAGTTWDRFAQLYQVGISDVNADLVVVPELLEELPTTENGGLTVEADGTLRVVMNIHPDARWEDGVPISGDDFFFTYQTLRDTDGLVLAPGSDPDLYDQIIPESVVVAPKSISFLMERPTLQHELLFPIVLPRHQMTGTDVLADWEDAIWLSGGPYIFESWDPGERMVFVRNPLYWKTDDGGLTQPYLERVEFRFYDSAAALVDAFRIREVDVITPPSVIQVLNALIPLVTEGAGVFVIPGVLWEHLAFQFGTNNRNEESLNQFVDFRRAIAYALDIEALVTSLYAGYNDSIDSYLDVYEPAQSSGAWSQYSYDVVEARRLIDRACGRVGRNCTEEPPVVVFTTTANDDLRVRTAALMEPMLADVGVRVQLELEPSSLFFGETLTAGSWDLGMWAYPGAPGSPALARAHDFLDPIGPPPFGNNYARWGTATVAEQEPITLADGSTVDVNQPASTVVDDSTERFAELRRAMDGAVGTAELLALVAEAEQLLADEAVVIPLWARLWIGAAWLDEIAGYEPNPGASADTWNIEEWFRVDLPQSG